jgi:hypothetical protein
MHWSDCFRTDAMAYKKNQDISFIYNRMELLCEQGHDAWPAAIVPDIYPVIIDHIVSLDEEETQTVLHDRIAYGEFIRASGTGGWFWTVTSDDPIIIIDVILHRGILRCNDAFQLTTANSGLPLAYTHHLQYSIPDKCSDFIQRTLGSYSGPASFRIQGTTIHDCRLRWNSLNYIWKQQIDFVKTAPTRLSSLKSLRPLRKELVYIPCWVNEADNHGELDIESLLEQCDDYELYSAGDRVYWRDYVRIGVFAISPHKYSDITSIKQRNGWT